ncbi:hypothetical protein HYH03_018825, partial [Edaphochlamys debaryana]
RKQKPKPKAKSKSKDKSKEGDKDTESAKDQAGAEGASKDEAGAGGAEGGAALGHYSDSAEGRLALATDILRTMRDTDYPELHDALLEACRDSAALRGAARALVAAGAVPQLVQVLSHKIEPPGEKASKSDVASHAWVVQSQRTAAAVVALLALDPTLRGEVVEGGAVEGLAAALTTHTGQTGLMAQVRITAAAALVPILSDDGKYDAQAVAAGVLEPLAHMYFARGSSKEQRAALRVLRLLERDPKVAEMYGTAGIDLDKLESALAEEAAREAAAEAAAAKVREAAAATEKAKAEAKRYDSGSNTDHEQAKGIKRPKIPEHAAKLAEDWTKSVGIKKVKLPPKNKEDPGSKEGVIKGGIPKGAAAKEGAAKKEGGAKKGGEGGAKAKGAAAAQGAKASAKSVKDEM